MVLGAPGQQEDIVDLTNGFEQAGTVDNNLIVEDSGQQGLDNVALNIDRGGLALKAVANGIDGAIYHGCPLGAIFLGGGGIGVNGEVGGRNELLYAVKGGVDQLAVIGFGSQL